MSKVDEARQSRTLYVLGQEAMERMSGSSCFLSGMSGLGVEIAKNVILTGVKEFTIHDTVNTEYVDLSTQFFLEEADVGKNRALQSAGKLAELNPSVTLSTSCENLDDIDLSFFDRFTVVILTNTPLKTQLRINEYCRSKGICFLSTEVRGAYGWTFVDFGPSFEVIDKNGEDLPEIMFSNISNGNPGICTTLEHHFHGLETGDVVEFREVVGMTELNGTRQKVTVLDGQRFSIGDTSSFHPYERDGIATHVKMPTNVSFKSLRESMDSPDMLTVDFVKLGAPAQMHLGMRALHAFNENNGHLPRPWHSGDAEELCSLAGRLKNGNSPGVEADRATLMRMAYTAQGALSPLTAFFGGFVAQEALKALTHKFTPLNQWLYLDAAETLPSIEGFDAAQFQPVKDRSDAQRIVLGADTCGKLADMRVFMVGAGAIGCEMLKNFALMGVGTGDGPRGCGRVVVTDNDVIEVSNLSRQFLFRTDDVTRPKSECAAAATTRMNPAMKVDARLDRVGKDTEHIYDAAFFEDVDCCVNALDNVAARLYMDARCVTAQRPLLESGTLGTKGHVQAIIPFLTESYASTHDPPEKDTPFCTIKSFPYQIQHTIQYARDKFAELFYNLPGEINKFFSVGDANAVADQLANNGGADAPRAVVRALLEAPTTYADCVAFARRSFENYFTNGIKQLLHAFPLDTRMKDGSLFWTLPKRPPTVLHFDHEDATHMAAIAHTARLWAEVWGVPLPPEGFDAPMVLTKALAGVRLKEFVPKADVKIEVDEKAKAPEKDDDLEDVGAVEVAALEQKLRQGLHVSVTPIEFEKDDDTNSHIDFITALSNLRARNYSIMEADRLATKRIAGNIIPAISTTTAAVSGLVALELIKVVLGAPLGSYKNAFINLALPLMALSEPGEVPKVRINDALSVTLWDTWDVRESDMPLLGDVVQHVKAKYDLTVKGVFVEAVMIYMAVFPAHKKRVKKRMRDLLKIKSSPPRYVDLTVSFADGNGEEVEGPTVRYFLDG